MQIKFVTRSGTNNFTGSGYYYYRTRQAEREHLVQQPRTASPRPKLKQNQAGVRVGGPIVIPGFDGHNKAFFFVNYEECASRATRRGNRTILNPAAQDGHLQLRPAASRDVNVLQLAAANGQLVDRRSDDRQAAGRHPQRDGSRPARVADVDANLQRFTFNVPVESMQRYPTVRVDYNLTDKHRASVRLQLPEVHTTSRHAEQPRRARSRASRSRRGQDSTRHRVQQRRCARRSASNLVNEARVGYSGAPVQFFRELTTSMFTGEPREHERLPAERSRPSGPR